MSAETILAIIAAAQQLLDVVQKEKALLSASDQATVDAALASLNLQADQVHQEAQGI